MNSSNCYPIRILNCLMRHGELTTVQLCELTGCGRKTVYTTMDKLEANGFGICVIEREGPYPSAYKFSGIYEFAK